MDGGGAEFVRRFSGGGECGGAVVVVCIAGGSLDADREMGEISMRAQGFRHGK
jgi:hypothetical protein